MRVMLDTNVILSAFLFPSRQMEQLFQTIVIHHRMVISSYVIEELHRVAERKFPQKRESIERLLAGMSYELVYTPRAISDILVEIRDGKDYPVIHTAIVEAVDVLITGDRDFTDLEIERPRIMTPKEFLEKFGI